MVKKLLFLIILSATIIVLFSTMVLANPTQTRLAGNDRYDTAIEISKNGWDSADYAVLATGENYPDALSVTPLAKKYNAPILLNGSTYLDSRVSSELKRLGVKKVFIAGGTVVVSAGIEQNLNAMGIATERLAGLDRYETAIKIGEKLDNISEIFVAVGTNFVDALSVASIAAIKGDPIVLVPQDELPTVVKNFVGLASKTYVIGDSSVISDKVISQLPNPERIMGNDKYDRNVAIMKWFTSEFNFSKIYAATGENYPDALSGSVLAAKTSSPVFLLGDANSSVTSNFFDSKKSTVNEVVALGGTAVVTRDMLFQLGIKSQASNAINNERLFQWNEVKIGMTQAQVRNLLGDPQLEDPYVLLDWWYSGAVVGFDYQTKLVKAIGISKTNDFLISNGDSYSKLVSTYGNPTSLEEASFGRKLVIYETSYGILVFCVNKDNEIINIGINMVEMD